MRIEENIVHRKDRILVIQNIQKKAQMRNLSFLQNHLVNHAIQEDQPSNHKIMRLMVIEIKRKKLKVIMKSIIQVKMIMIMMKEKKIKKANKKMKNLIQKAVKIRRIVIKNINKVMMLALSLMNKIIQMK